MISDEIPCSISEIKAIFHTVEYEKMTSQKPELLFDLSREATVSINSIYPL